MNKISTKIFLEELIGMLQSVVEVSLHMLHVPFPALQLNWPYSSLTSEEYWENIGMRSSASSTTAGRMCIMGKCSHLSATYMSMVGSSLLLNMADICDDRADPM